jgi:IS5 family transposase
MGEVSDTREREREREVKSRFSRENFEETNSIKDQGVERKMTSKEMLKRQDVDGIHRAENRDKRLALVKRVMNLRVKIFGNFLE